MYKKIIIFFSIFLYSFQFGFSQFEDDLKSYNQEDFVKLKYLCKTWGFLKYYHPNISQLDWDQELIIKIPQILETENINDINIVISDWINKLGTVKESNKASKNNNYFEKNFDLNWIYNENNILNKDIIKSLKNIEKNRNRKLNIYSNEKTDFGAKILNERSYDKSYISQFEYRLLDLFRYWNIIEYFFPYKYQTDQNWDDVLIEMIPKFISVNDESNYILLLYELVAKIDDSHAILLSDCALNCFGEFWAPFGFKIINNQIVIDKYYDEELAIKDDIRLGDIILNINDENAVVLLEDKLKYANGSNPYSKYGNMFNRLLNGNDDLLTLIIERDGKIINKQVRRYKFSEFKPKIKSKTKWNLIEDKIAYVDLENIKQNDVKEMMPSLIDTDAIIFDLRNGADPSTKVMKEISKYINKSKMEFAKTITPALDYPGKFIWNNRIWCGKNNNKNPYKGKVILLVNEDTQSVLESYTMCFQTSPKSLTIGSQTSGANGNVVVIPLVFDKNSTWFSGYGIFYPDGTETQRNGVKIDIEVFTTVNDIKEGRDEVLEKALDILN